MIGYIAALVPVYIFLYLPLSQYILGGSKEAVQTKIIPLNSSFIASNDPVSCSPHSFNTHILSNEPLVIYIENFLSSEESQHLLKIRSEPNNTSENQ